MIFDKIIDIEKILLGDHDVLTKIKKTAGGNIIMPEGGGLNEASNQYAEIIVQGPLVTDQKFAVGNIILAAAEGRGNKSFTYKKADYVIFSVHSVGVVVTPDNFKAK